MSKDDKLLKLARQRFDLAKEADQKQRQRELSDLRFYAGEQWDDDLLKARQGTTIGSGTTAQVVPARPSLTINKTREPVRQILNQERQSDLGIELIPADDWGDTTGPIDHTEIELREGLVRRIQRDSEAADARTWAFSRATIAGRGYWLVLTRYVPGKTWDQEIYIDRIYNQASVLLDPSHEQPDGSDAEWGFYGTEMSWQAYKAEFPSSAKKHNQVSTCDNDNEWRMLGDEAPGWFEGEGETRTVRVMNYYYTEREDRELALLEDGSVAWADELPEGVEPKETRRVIKKSIKWCKIDGYQVLDETDWPGHWLPIIKTVGDELQPYDNERRCEGVVRPMLDACKGNNYIISKFVERVGLSPIPPWMMAGGQDEGYEDEYDAANTRALSRLHYNLKDSNGMLAPPPSRTDVRSEIADIGLGVQLFGQAIQSTSVTPETALGNTDATVKSGKLAKILVDQAERGTSNFLDNLVRSMRHEARVINDLLYPIYGRPGRLARMMNGQGEMSSVLIGQPFTMQGEGKQARPQPLQGVQPGQPMPEGAKLYELTPDADFNVAVKISKSLETRRQQIAQFLGEIIAASPEQMQIIGDKLWKYIDVPDHEEIEKRYKVMLAPPIQQLMSGDSPLPPEAQQKIAMLEGQLQELAPLADKNKSDLMKMQAQQQAESERTAADIASREKIERWKLEVQLEIESMKLGNAKMMKRAELDANLLHQHTEGQLSAQERAETMAMDGAESEASRQHDREMAELQQAQVLEQGEQGHLQALEQQAMQPTTETP